MKRPFFGTWTSETTATVMAKRYSLFTAGGPQMPWPDLCFQPKKGFRRTISRLCWDHQAKHLIRNSRPLENTSGAYSLQNRSFVQAHPAGFSPLQFPPFPHKQRVPRLGPEPSRARSEAKPYLWWRGLGRTISHSGKKGHGLRCGGGAAFDPGFGFFDFVSTGLAAPTTCLNYYVFSICICFPLARTLEGGNVSP